LHLRFLTNRKFVVKIGGKTSEIKQLDRGCVQGSILGPKLFTPYTHQFKEILSDVKVISYADDAYVIISKKSRPEQATFFSLNYDAIEHIFKFLER